MADFKVGQRVRINERNVIGHIADIDDNPTTERSIFVETEFSYTGWYPPEGLSDPAAPPDDTDDDPEVLRLSAELDRLQAQLAQATAERDAAREALKPFAALDRWNTTRGDGCVVTASLESLMTVLPMGDFTRGDIRRAAAVLAQSEVQP